MVAETGSAEPLQANQLDIPFHARPARVSRVFRPDLAAETTRMRPFRLPVPVVGKATGSPKRPESGRSGLAVPRTSPGLSGCGRSAPLGYRNRWRQDRRRPCRAPRHGNAESSSVMMVTEACSSGVEPVVSACRSGLDTGGFGFGSRGRRWRWALSEVTLLSARRSAPVSGVASSITAGGASSTASSDAGTGGRRCFGRQSARPRPWARPEVQRSARRRSVGFGGGFGGGFGAVGSGVGTTVWRHRQPRRRTDPDRRRSADQVTVDVGVADVAIAVTVEIGLVSDWGCDRSCPAMDRRIRRRRRRCRRRHRRHRRRDRPDPDWRRRRSCPARVLPWPSPSLSTTGGLVGGDWSVDDVVVDFSRVTPP